MSDNTKFEMVYPTVVRPKTETISILPTSGGDNMFPVIFVIKVFFYMYTYSN